MGAAVGENLRDAHRSTPHWLATLGRDVKHYQASLSALQGIRERYQSGGDGRVIARINHLIQQVSSATRELIMTRRQAAYRTLDPDTDTDRSVPGMKEPHTFTDKKRPQQRGQARNPLAVP